MIHSLSIIVALHVAGLMLNTAVLMHPVHETLCEVEWNSEERCVEVAMRVDVLDEQWMKKKWLESKRPDPSGGHEASNWRIDLLRQQFLFDPTTGPAPDTKRTGRPLRWVGRKSEGAHVWWFFEVVCRDGRPPESAESTLLLDRHPDYQHHIVVLGNPPSKKDKGRSVTLTKDAPKAAIELLID